MYEESTSPADAETGKGSRIAKTKEEVRAARQEKESAAAVGRSERVVAALEKAKSETLTLFFIIRLVGVDWFWFNDDGKWVQTFCPFSLAPV